MKNYLFIILALSFTLTSCEGFLTKENPNKIESEFYFSDESSLKIYTNGLIRSFDIDLKSFIDGDKYADCYSWDGQYAYYMDNYVADDASNWSTGNWSQLRSINYYLDNMRKAKAPAAILDHYEGVGRFFRALFYFYKVETFGAVPYYDKSIDPADHDALYKGRDNREDVFKKILEDIDYACDHCLGTSEYRTRASYINKYVALAFKARMCLYEGTYVKYHSVDPSTGKAWRYDESKMYLQECAKACEEIMNAGIYSLVDNPANRRTQYRQMFIDDDACSSYAPEWIWAKDYDLALNVVNTSYSINDYMINAQHANYAFTRQFVDTYLMLDGTPFTSKYADYDSLDFVTETTDRDYRLSQTIRTPGFTRDKGTTTWAPDLTFSKTGYQPVKYLLDDSGKDDQHSATASDVPMMRYAEVLLNYAEAKADLGEMTKAVWDKTIKLIRQRSGVVSIYPTSADPYMEAYFQNKISDPYILEVRRERGIELTMEDLRYNDIMRWHQGELLARPWKGIWISKTDTPLDLNNDGKAESILTSNSKFTSALNILKIDSASEAGHKLSGGNHGIILPATALQRKWYDYKYVRPIPTTAIQENPNLEQNPQW
jgi:starch-binding outer membrane protein, SusD/RagB family